LCWREGNISGIDRWVVGELDDGGQRSCLYRRRHSYGKSTVEINQGQKAGLELLKNQADQAVKAVDAVVYEAA